MANQIPEPLFDALYRVHTHHHAAYGSHSVEFVAAWVREAGLSETKGHDRPTSPTGSSPASHKVPDRALK